MLSEEITARFLQELRKEKGLFEAVHALLCIFQHRRHQTRVFAAGGIVRDLAVCRCQNLPFRFRDLDLVAEGVNDRELEAVLDELIRESLCVEGADRVGKSFAVWKMRVAGFPDPIDLALTRTEWSLGTHHRDFEVSTDGVTIEQDSLRRDFTMNALYVELQPHSERGIAGRLLDFHGGMASIVARRIDCVGNPRERFLEDPLRMLRAIRFRARLPGFEIGKSTAAAIYELIPELLKTVSKERIAEELFEGLLAHPERGLHDLTRYGVLREAFPDIDRLSKRSFRDFTVPPLTGGREEEFNADGEAQPCLTGYLARTARRLDHLLTLCAGTVDEPLLFAAFLFDVALVEAETTLRRFLAATKISSRRFQAGGVSRIARDARLPSAKKITQLCSDVLCLIHFDLLENADATLEAIMSRYEEPEVLLALYRANQFACEIEPRDFAAAMQSHRPARIDFNRLIQNSGIPVGPHLNELKLRLRQLEIEGEIASEAAARIHLNGLYLEDTHLIQEHIIKLSDFLATQPRERSLPAKLREEIRWLLFTRPIRLIRSYQESDLLPQIFPELAEAEEVCKATPHHFVEDYLNNAYLGLSLLAEVTPTPLPVHVLAILLLDIGKARTIQVRPDGKITYHRHATVGAGMADDICKRLGVEESIVRDVRFIVREHSNFLYPREGAARLRKLLKHTDEGLIADLLLVIRIHQISKMRIQDGRRIDEGQLDTCIYLERHLDEWRAELVAKERSQEAAATALVSGRDLMSDHPAWGLGMPQGPEVGRVKGEIMTLQTEGAIRTREDAIRHAQTRIVIYHLTNRPATYLETLQRRGFLEELLPEIAALVDLDQASPHHSEDAFTHTLNVIRALPAGVSRECLLAAVFHDVGKTATRSFDEEKGVYHFYEHETESELLFEGVCERFGWNSRDFDREKTAWLIRNHLLPKVDWEKTRDPRKTVERLLFRGKEKEGVRKDYRDDLLALRFADILGAVTEDETVRQALLEGHRLLRKLVCEVEQDLERKAEQEVFEGKVKALWNGNAVLRHFQAEGKAIGRLVKLGQDYVRTRLAAGAEEVPEGEIIDYLSGL